jgi:hypothetical protein
MMGTVTTNLIVDDRDTDAFAAAPICHPLNHSQHIIMMNEPPEHPVIVAARDEDRLIFGHNNSNDSNDMTTTTNASSSSSSLGSVVGDAMAKAVDEALKEGIATLPLLHGNNSSSSRHHHPSDHSNDDNNDNHAEVNLLQRLTKEYYRNIDILELYATHHIFTLSMFPPTKRRAIVQAYHQHQQQQVETKTLVDKDTTTTKMSLAEDENDKATLPLVPPPLPTMEQIPTAHQMKALTLETQQLRIQLQTLRVQRQELAVKCRALEQVQSKCQQVQQAFASATTMNGKEPPLVAMDQSVTAVIMGTQGLEQLRARGVELLQELDERQLVIHHNNNTSKKNALSQDTLEKENHLTMTTTKKQKWDMDQQYPQQRSQVTTSSLETLRSMMVHSSDMKE